MAGNTSEGEKITNFMTTLAYLALINLLTILCSLPIITIGPSLKAMHSCVLKLKRKEEGYIARMYFTAWKDEFKKSVLLWLPFLLIFSAVIFDYINQEIFNRPIIIMVTVVGILTFLLFQFVFPLAARFENSVMGTIENSMRLAIAKFPRTFLMAVMWIIPYLLSKYIVTIPLFILFGFSLPAYLDAVIYDPVFRQIEKAQGTGKE